MLALGLGKSLRELDSCMDVAEFMGWMARYARAPWGMADAMINAFAESQRDKMARKPEQMMAVFGKAAALQQRMAG